MSVSLPPLNFPPRRRQLPPLLLLLFQFLLFVPTSVAVAATTTTTKKKTIPGIGFGGSVISSNINGMVTFSLMRRRGAAAVAAARSGIRRRSRRCHAFDTTTNNNTPLSTNVGAAFINTVARPSLQARSKPRITPTNMPFIISPTRTRTIPPIEVDIRIHYAALSSSTTSSIEQNKPTVAVCSSNNNILPSVEARGRRWRHYCNYSIHSSSPDYHSSSSSALFATVPKTEESLEFSDLDYFNSHNNNIAPAGTSISGWMENGDVVDIERKEVDNINYDIAESKDEFDIFHGIKSRPNEEKGGEGKGNNRPSWNPSDPLGWCKSFGSRSQANTDRLAALVKLRPGDEGYFDVSDMDHIDITDITDVVTTTVSTTATTTNTARASSKEQENVPPPPPLRDNNNSVTIVRTPEQAATVMAALMKAKSENPQLIFACDTEVMDIDLKEVGPVGNGYVTCLSVYAGPDFDFGLGNGPGTTLWVDNLDDACGVLQDFKPWLEDKDVLKVWHNYGFDRHVLFNEGINVLGFGGDTMHMARLCDTSRMKYSLESLTEDLLKERKIPMKEIFGEGK